MLVKMHYLFNKLYKFFFLVLLLIAFSFTKTFGQTNCGTGAGTSVLVTVNSTCPAGASDATIGTYTVNNCGVPNRESWFRFVATASTATIVGTMSSGASTATELLIEVYSACAPASIISCTNTNTSIQTAQTETLVITGLSIGSTYFVRLVNTSGFNSSTSLCVTSPQPNDEPSGAIMLTTPSGTVCTNTAGSVVSASTSSCALPGCANFTGTAVDVWYKVVVPASGDLFLKMTTLNAGIATYSGTPGAGNDCGNLTLLACSGGNPVGIVATSPASALVPTLYTNATPGSTVYVRVWNEDGVAQGSFNLCASDLGPCGNTNTTPNDWCSNAGAIMTSGTPGVGTHTISSTYTSDSPGNIASTSPIITCGGTNNNMWFSFISDGSALNVPIAISTSSCASLYAQVYSVTKTPAGCCKDFTPISSNAPTCTAGTYSFNPTTGGNIVTPPLTAGQTYYLMISNKTNNQTCAFSLTGWAVDGILPVYFESFIGINNGKFNKLEWISASEQNVLSYTLEHSPDGLNFFDVQTLSVKSNNYNNNKYIVNDEDYFENVTYYRIRQNMLGGKKEYSHTISVSLGNKYDNIYNILPNPTSDVLNFEYYSKGNSNISLELIGYAGNTVFRQTKQLDEGKNNITLPMNELDNGVYILKVVSEKTGKTTHHKIIKN